MRWVEISIEATESSIDAVSNILVEEGCGGSVIGPTLASAAHACTRVAGYLPVDDRLETRLSSIRDRVRLLPTFGLPLESDEVTVTWVEDEEWATAWKKHFKPVRVGRVIVKPPWEEFPTEPGDVVVSIDPGMAFGTGYHPTTQLCLLALQDHIKGGETVLDVGTGSGVLAIAAVLLGAVRAEGLDFDSVAVEAATENVEQAQLSDRIIIRQADTPMVFDGHADLIVANIIPAVLIEMAKALAAKVKPGGIVLGSGIVTERAESVKTAFDGVGLRLLEERTDGEWVALVCEKAT